MFCSKCGAVVTGNYCCVCGKRVLTQLEEYRKVERRAKKAFLDSIGTNDLLHMNLAFACWYVAEAKHAKNPCGRIESTIKPEAYENLKRAESYARELYAEFLLRIGVGQ